MRASWRGYVRIGDVMFPVKLYSGVRSVTPQYIRLHAKDHSPITQIITCQKDGEQLESSDVIRAVEVNGKYIEISETDIEVSGAANKNIAVRQFSEPSEIDPVYYDKPYYIVPGKGGELAYTIMRQAFIRSNKVAIVTYMFYEKEHLGIIRTIDGILLLQQLRFAEELVQRRDIDTPSLPQPLPADVDIAAKLMNRYSSSFFIDDYQNEQLSSLNEIIERKAKGLPPKRRSNIASETTPEDEVVKKFEALLEGNPAELRGV
jgi:DNA end-binding protein Ku